MSDHSNISRRGLLKGAAVATVSAAAMSALGTNYAWAAGSDTIRVGLIGCGGRGTGAAHDACAGAENVEIIAMGDVFPDRLASSKDQMKDLGEKLKVKDEHCFTGFDAYQKVLGLSEVNYVILSTPPGFRSTHLKAAVEAGKNVFMEKPVAVDPTEVRSVIESGEMAEKKGLAIVTGTQRRHQGEYIETIKRIHDGAIGEIVSGNCYWNQGSLWMHPRKPEWSDMEYQIRNWIYFTWIGGDHIVEQHVHNIDVINWVMNGPPVSAYGMGGRQVRTDPAYGHIFDHFAIEYIYANGARVTSMCRQQDGTDSRVGEYVVGTKGNSNCSNRIKGAEEWKYKKGTELGPYQQEHADLIASIREGKPLNEAKRIAESTLTAIMGRMSAYTGKLVTWEQAMKSEMSLMPSKIELGPIPVAPVAMPGKDKVA
jgi:predicted dehydrogenase